MLPGNPLSWQHLRIVAGASRARPSAGRLAPRQQGPRTAHLLGDSTQHARLGTLKSFLAWLTNPPDDDRTRDLEFT